MSVLREGKPTSLKEWEQQMSSLKQLQETLDRRQELSRSLESAGGSPSPDEQATLRQDVQETDKLRDALASQRKVLELADLDTQYRDMERKKGQLYDSYTRAFGTAKQGAEAQRVRTHLQQMYENRVAAQKMGSAKASQQAAGILKEIQRIK
jgi:t-SNARE complex subunit (syntaxin)